MEAGRSIDSKKTAQRANVSNRVTFESAVNGIDARRAELGHEMVREYDGGCCDRSAQSDE
jgi:hypothetical protein